MLPQIAIGSAVIVATIVLVGLFAMATTAAVARAGPWLVRAPHRPKLMLILIALLLAIQAAVSVCVWLWALTFWALGLFPAMEPALYFAVVSFTTLGFGDILLPVDWRLLSGFAASNGLLLFGLFTAFLVEIMRRVRDEQRRGIPDPE